MASPGPTDLDLLIGELEDEAARRRAEPAFPIDADARLRRELDEVAPGRRSSPDELIQIVLDAARKPPPAVVEDGPAPRMVTRWLRPTGPSDLADRVEQLGTAVAVALQMVFDDSRARPALEATSRASTVVDRRAGASEAPDLAALDTWGPDLVGRRRPGRVLCAGTGGAALVDHLQGQGVDAYGIDAGADLVSHLASLPSSISVVLAGATLGGLADLRRLVAELQRTAPSVEVVSVAPWWWRAASSPGDADLSSIRPASVETWLEALSAAGYEATARYDGLGRSYELVAVRR